MSIRRLHNLPVLCLLLLALLTSPASASAFVWCIGADGHSHANSTKSTGDGCCGTQQTAQPAACGQELSTEEQDHGHCLHIALTGQPVLSGSRDSQTPDDAAATEPAACAKAFPHATASHPDARLLAKTTPRMAGPLLHHRTIVLLI